MSRHPVMITNLAHIRKWWRENETEIMGYVYNDNDGFWNDGDFGVFTIEFILDPGGSFWVLIANGKTLFRLDKDDELPRSKGIV
jgi:hypothetical protein